MRCKWCGVERGAPAVGAHACDPANVRYLALYDAAELAKSMRVHGVAKRLGAIASLARSGEVCGCANGGFHAHTCSAGNSKAGA
jgi:hypothetical protein